MSKTYKIFLHDLKLQAIIGVFDEERLSPQPVIAQIELLAKLPEGLNDDYEKILCYKTLTESIEDIVKTSRPKLLETLAGAIGELCLQNDNILSARIRLEKPQALGGRALPAIEIYMEKPQ